MRTSRSTLPSPPAGSPASIRARWLMIVSVCFFVCNALVIRILGTKFAVDSWTISAARFTLGMLIVLLPFVPGGKLSLRALVKNPLLIGRGVFGGLGVIIYYQTIGMLGVGRATFINNTYIIFGAALASVFLRERLRPAVLLALVLGMLGIALLTGMTLESWHITTGDWLALTGALSAGIVIVLIRRLHQGESTRTIFAGQCAWGLCFTAVPSAASWEAPAMLAISALVLSGVLAATGQLTMTAAYRLVPVAEGALLQMLTPVGIGIGGMILFGEHYTLPEAIGAALIVVSCILASMTRPRLAAGLPATADGKPKDRPPSIRREAR